MFRSFAIVPAAGRSVRMGRPKLLLPLAGRPVIDYVLTAWTSSRATRTVVVVRNDDAALIDRCRAFPVDVVTPLRRPADMKASIQAAISHISQRYSPADGDAWLLAPADLPRLNPAHIDRLLAAYNPTERCAVAPTYAGRRGHPIVMPWSSAREINSLAADEGLNVLVAHTTRRETPCSDSISWQDLDDQADYDRLLVETASNNAGFQQ